MISEIHKVHTGDQFSFTEDGPVNVVASPDRMIDSQNAYLVIYSRGDAMLGHPCDHTPVWLRS